MAVHAFDEVTIDKQSNTLIVVGHSDEALDSGTKLHVAVMAVDDADTRCETTTDVTTGPWTVDGPWTPEPPFSNGDDVVAVGRVVFPDQTDHLWGNPLRIGAKPTG